MKKFSGLITACLVLSPVRIVNVRICLISFVKEECSVNNFYALG
ncbi:MAG TPA: hypothetical protein PLU81_08405 [Deltaproteobacteria bacterium]|nr:hypothetical protein [Deltaproteobacteria bacterium]HPJ93334.1 hypothetical protein [Deltaproteobacteria bacterium]HPR51794.1 hypothetical protein [Deltaproteobacteria bacterium]